MKEKPPVPTFFEEKPPPPRGGGGGGGQQQEQQNREVRESGPEEEEMMPPLPVYVAPEWSGPPEGQTSFSLEVLKSGQVVDLIVLTTATTTTSKVDDDDVVPKSRSYVTFGRHPLCDVVIEHPSSSRLHCVLQFKKNTKEMYLFDPGSTHGVFVNKRKLKKGIHAPIFVGDQIKFGESTRDYIVQGDEALMPECGLTNRELEKVKEIQKRREMEQRKDEEEKEDGRSRGGVGDGLGRV